MPYAGELTLEDIAWCADVAAPRLRSWASAQRLKHHGPFGEHDAVEAAIAFALVKAGVSQKAAPGAWRDVRPEVRRLLLAGSDDPWIVVSADGPTAAVADGAAEAAEAGARLGKCWLVRLAPAIARAKERYAAALQRADIAAGDVTALRAGSVRNSS